MEIEVWLNFFQAVFIWTIRTIEMIGIEKIWIETSKIAKDEIETIGIESNGN